MRIYTGFRDALGEIERELSEMGILVHTQTMQDKHIGDNPDFATVELQNYGYSVTNPKLGDLNPTQPWADAEFEERVSGQLVNPGEAYKLRPGVWDEFLETPKRYQEDSAKFSYTYAERFEHNDSREAGDPDNPDGPSQWNSSTQLEQLITNLKKYPDNRNHLLTVWDVSDLWRVGEHRVPCSISYHFMYRNGTLFMTYNQRSADFVTHLENDIYLAAKLQAWVGEQVGWPVGRFTHLVASLHAYRKDVEGVF